MKGRIMVQVQVRVQVQVGVSESLEAAVEVITTALTGQGYASSSIRKRVRLLARLDGWLRGEGLGFSDLDDLAVEQFRVFHQMAYQSRPTVLAPVVGLLRTVGVISPASEPVAGAGPVEDVLQQWGAYLPQDREFKPETIRWYLRWGRPFLVSLVSEGTLDTSVITGRDVVSFLSERIPELPDAASKRTLTALRSLLRFLYATGQVPDRLDAVVPAMARRDRGLPRWLDAGQVAAVVESCDLSTSAGRRDRAIVVVIARLGLRAGEVARLRLDDIHWRAGTIRIHGKGHYLDTMPLPMDVGAAIADHLADPRPPTATARALFLSCRPPYVPLSAAAIGCVVAAAGRRAGLDSSDRTGFDTVLPQRRLTRERVWKRPGNCCGIEACNRPPPTPRSTSPIWPR